jgi:hypothetical protein
MRPRGLKPILILRALRGPFDFAQGRLLKRRSSTVAQANSRFLHSAVADAPAPVGMTKFSNSCQSQSQSQDQRQRTGVPFRTSNGKGNGQECPFYTGKSDGNVKGCRALPFGRCRSLRAGSGGQPGRLSSHDLRVGLHLRGFLRYALCRLFGGGLYGTEHDG